MALLFLTSLLDKGVFKIHEIQVRFYLIITFLKFIYYSFWNLKTIHLK